MKSQVNKTKMKHPFLIKSHRVLYLSILLMFSFILPGKGQFFIESISVLPEHPNNTQNTELVIKMDYDISGCGYKGNNVTFANDTFRVNEYFDCGFGFGWPCIKMDTLNLGTLSFGMFYGKLYMNNITNFYYPADTSLQDSLLFSFNVSENSSIESLTMNPFFATIKPNPSNGLFIIKFKNNGLHNRIKICDIAGHEMREIDISELSDIINLDLSCFCNGTYLISFISENMILSTKKVTLSK